MNIRGVSDKYSEENGKYVTENWRKGDTCYIVTESFTELWSSFT